MAKSKSHRDEEDLRGQLRELQKENRALRKRLKTLERSKHVWQQYNLDADERTNERETKEDVVSCPSCKSGTVLYVDLGTRMLHSCSVCTWRKVSLK